MKREFLLNAFFVSENFFSILKNVMRKVNKYKEIIIYLYE